MLRTQADEWNKDRQGHQNEIFQPNGQKTEHKSHLQSLELYRKTENKLWAQARLELRIKRFLILPPRKPNSLFRNKGRILGILDISLWTKRKIIRNL